MLYDSKGGSVTPLMQGKIEISHDYCSNPSKIRAPQAIHGHSQQIFITGVVDSWLTPSSNKKT